MSCYDGQTSVLVGSRVVAMFCGSDVLAMQGCCESP